MAKVDWSKYPPTVAIRVSRAERDLIDAIAEARGTNMTSVIREFVSNGLAAVRASGAPQPTRRRESDQGELPLTG